VFAPGRMLDNFLPIPEDPDSESLPLYRMVLKLDCVFQRRRSQPAFIFIIMIRRRSQPAFIMIMIMKLVSVCVIMKLVSVCSCVPSTRLCRKIECQDSSHDGV
jgi:hypothetical protein